MERPEGLFRRVDGVRGCREQILISLHVLPVLQCRSEPGAKSSNKRFILTPVSLPVLVIPLPLPGDGTALIQRIGKDPQPH